MKGATPMMVRAQARTRGRTMASSLLSSVRMGSACGAVVALLAVGLPACAGAAEVLVAVAANFLNPMKDIAVLFEAATGHRAILSPGSSGRLYAQLKHGAPFEIFLSADRERPRLLERAGLAVAGSRLTYAYGRLALWSHSETDATAREALLARHVAYVAIANPKTAPYGKAAVQLLKRWLVWERLKPRLVQGENIAQALQFVDSRNAQIGFVALSQLRDPRFGGGGTQWIIPPELHDPLEQDVVLMKRGRSNPAAGALLQFLQTSSARAVIRRFGYGLEPATREDERDVG